VVEDRQLSLAIGKKGQNVRLAAKLSGWKIDIKSEEEKRKEVELQLAGIEFPGGAEAARPLTLPDIHEEVLAALRAGGFDTVEKVLAANTDELLALPGFDQETVDAVVAAARAEQAAQAQEAAEAPAADGAAADSAEGAAADSAEGAAADSTEGASEESEPAN
jgi:transcription termination/antitermination protein NusA